MAWSVENLPAVGDRVRSLSPGSPSPWRRNGNLLQYSRLDNPAVEEPGEVKSGVAESYMTSATEHAKDVGNA